MKRELLCLCKQGQEADKISLVWTLHPGGDIFSMQCLALCWYADGVAAVDVHN